MKTNSRTCAELCRSILNEKGVRALLDQYAREGRLLEAAPAIMAQVSKELRAMMKNLNPTVPQPSTINHKPFSFSDSTFMYECCDETRNQRLVALFNGLKQLGWIDARTPQKQFIDLFSGEPLYHRIHWTGSKQHLAYFFKILINEKKYVRTTHARIWMTVRSHFVQDGGMPFEEDMKDQQIPGDKPSRIILMLVELLNPSVALPKFRG